MNGTLIVTPKALEMAELKTKLDVRVSGGISLAAQHFDITVPYPRDQCLTLLEKLGKGRQSWWNGGKVVVSLVPMGPDLTKFHMMQHISAGMEVEAVGTVQMITDTTTAIIWLVRFPQSTLVAMGLYVLMYLIPIVWFINISRESTHGLDCTWGIVAFWIISLTLIFVRCFWSRYCLTLLLLTAFSYRKGDPR